MTICDENLGAVWDRHYRQTEPIPGIARVRIGRVKMNMKNCHGGARIQSFFIENGGAVDAHMQIQSVDGDTLCYARVL